MLDSPMKDENITCFVYTPSNEDEEETYQRFPLKEEQKRSVYIKVLSKSSSGFLNVASDCAGQLWMGMEQSNSYCKNLSSVFEGMTDDKCLTGHDGQKQEDFYHCRNVFAFNFVETREC